ncbi:MAG TPA: SDR family NAD(P)-dependent oxidoreductase, partial [Spirochaetia bacterium]|nr:SDR family NAD(P)-dependent oxidoreductase [Spirochaetia bacterium]
MNSQEMERRFSLDGRTALVTGSSRGLGLVFARGLRDAGAAVVLNGRDEGRLAAAVAELRIGAAK